MSQKPINTFQPNYSKFVVPGLAKQYVARERLIKRLNTAANHKFILLQAPRGYGKSLLLSDWYHKDLCQADDKRAIWFKVDENDADPSCFWRNIIEAFNQCWPGFQEALEKRLEIFEQSSPHELAIAIANRILQTVEPNKHYTIILMNFESFKFSPSESQFFALASMLPSNINIVISSRIFLNNHILQMGVYSELAFIGVDELSLTKDELRTYLIEQLQIEVPEAAIGNLYEKTQGWPLAVDIVLQEIQSGKDAQKVFANFNGNNQAFGDFIFFHTTKNLPSRVYSFLLETSYLKRFSPSLCDYVTSSQESLDIIEYLVRNGVFTYSVNPDGQWFQYHPLFADWLRSQSLKLRRDQLRLLNHRAGQWYRDKKMYLLAARHVIAATEGDFVIRLTKVVFDDLEIDQAQLWSWLFLLDEEEFETNPKFCLLAAWAFVFSGCPNDTYRWCEKAQLNTTDKKEVALLDLSARTIDAKCHTLKGDNDQGIELSTKLVGESNLLMNDLLKMVLFQNLGEAYEQIGNIETALKHYHKAMTIARINQFEFLTGFTRYQVLSLLFRQGQFSKAEELCWLGISECPPDFTVYGAIYSILGMIKLEQYKYKELEIYNHRAFSRVSADRNIDIYIEVCTARSRYLSIFHMLNDAHLQLAAAIAAIKSSPDVPPRGVVYQPFELQARLYINQHDIESAQETISEFYALGYPPSSTGYLRLELLDARFALEKRQNLADIAEKLEQLEKQITQMSFNMTLVELLVLQAVLYYRFEQNTKALKYLKRALGLAKKEQMIGIFLAEGDVVRILLLELIGSAHLGHETESFIHSLLGAFDGLRFGEQFSIQNANNEPDLLAANAARTDERIVSLWNLTNREQEVLRMLQKGMNRKDIAYEFCTSQNTVKTHIAHIYEKIGVHSLPDLMRTLMENAVL